LQAAAIARQSTNKSPLLPNRIHWSSKAPDGLFFSFHHEHSPTPAQIYRHEGKPLGYVFAPGYGSRPDDDDSVALAIVRHSRLGNWYLAGFDRHESVVEPSEASPQNYDQWKSQIGVGPGKLASPLQIFSLSKTGSLGEMRVDFDPSIGALGSGGVQLWAQEMDEDERDELSPLGAFSRLQMTILAEAALQQQPVYADGSRKYKPNQGRRLLIFSDSRAAAAKLGPRLTDNHETQLFRAAVVEALEKGALTGGDKQALDEELRSALELQAQAPVQMQQLMQAGIDQLREKIASSREGMSPTEFAVQLGNTERIGEFFCRSSGERTRADNWDQDKFDLNKDEMKTAISESLGRELARRAVWPTTDLQTTGLVELSYPGLEKIGIPKAWEGVLVDPGVADKLRLVFSDYLALLCDELRLQGAVTLNDPEKDREYGGGKVRLGRWVSKEHTYLRGLFAFVPGDRGNRLFRFTQRMLTDCGACIKESKNLSRRLMADVFDRLIDEKDSLPWMEVEPRQSDVGATTDAFRIKFLATGIRRPGSLYSCSRTEEVWGRSAAGHYPKSSGASLAKASLEEIDALPRSGRARREWKDSKIFRYGLWAEEHSAQLSPAENRRLQDLFKLGIRNILSSTTTLELGIDIGGLNGVLMGNIPPGKANYLQRAGRAGRRADGSSLVLSYAGSSPFERKIHEDFGAFFAMPLRKPTIFLERADILKRHLTAFLLGRFFREIHTAEDHVGAMRAFGNVGSFVNARQPQYWKDGVKPSIVTPGNVVNITVGGKESTTFNSLAKAFCAYLEAIPTNGLVLGELAILAKGTVLGEVVQSGIKGFTHAVLDQVKGAIERWEEIYNNLVDTWDSLPPHHEPANARQANAMRHQTNQLFNITVIEFFSDALIVPKYGFPTGLAELKVQEDPDRKDEEDPSSDPSYRLSRSAVQAIQEYAPGSKILAGAKVIESAGILKSWTGDDLPDDGMGLRAYYRKEKVSGQFSYQYSPYTPHDIAFDYGQMLFVKHGFTTAASNPPHYGRETERVGECDASCQDDNAVEVLKFDRFTNQKTVAAKLVVGGQMLARNTGRYGRGFAVCTKCGCAESEFVENGNGAIDLPGTMDHHAPLDWRKKKASDKRLWCWKPETAAVLRNLELSAQQIADYAEFSLPRFLGPSRTLGRTLAQAMRLAGSELLMLDPREITVVGVQTGSKFGFCLADSLAGGAGHLRDLCASQQETWWQKTCELIQTGSPKEALLRLITSDVPRRAGRADFSIDEARLYLQNFGVAQGNLFDDDFNEIDPLSEMSSKSPT
jgi:DEAD/DEAH box helicase domain-containing protein